MADYNEAQLKAAIIKRTQKVIVPMDRTKPPDTPQEVLTYSKQLRERLGSEE